MSKAKSAEGGPIGLIREGDIVEIDIPNNKLAVQLSDNELAERKKDWAPPAPRFTTGWLSRYAKMATNASNGAVLEG